MCVGVSGRGSGSGRVRASVRASVRLRVRARVRVHVGCSGRVRVYVIARIILMGVLL